MIGALVIEAFPGETFAFYGMEVKRRSPFPETLSCAYSDGCVTNIPTRDAYPKEGCSFFRRYHIPDMLFLQTYGVGSASEPGSLEMVVDETVRLVHDIWKPRKKASAVTV